MSLGKYKISKVKEEGQTFWHADFPNGTSLNLDVDIAKDEAGIREYIDEHYADDPDFTRSKKGRQALNAEPKPEK